MNDALQAAEELLAELREAYRSLPRHLQADVNHVLSALAQERSEGGHRVVVSSGETP